MQINKIGAISLYQSEVLMKGENLVHGFTTREGGVSENEYSSLSLSPMRGDDIECVRKNRQILCDALSLDISRLTSTHQTHTNNVRVIDATHTGYGITTPWEEGVDGIITTQKNVPLLCYSADCVPILLYASDIDAIGAVHAGWRGTSSKIVSVAISKLKGMGSSPENICVAIGPCIGKCCYEVGGDVAAFFDKKYYTEKSGDKFMLDLALVNYDLALHCGVSEGNISLSSICTRCHNDLFFSHRGQNGKCGTLGAIICMKD